MFILNNLLAKDEKVGFIHLLDVYNIGRGKNKIQTIKDACDIMELHL
jgi:hypothetical protein